LECKKKTGHDQAHRLVSQSEWKMSVERRVDVPLRGTEIPSAADIASIPSAGIDPAVWVKQFASARAVRVT
jgi:hypothetical protein